MMEFVGCVLLYNINKIVDPGSHSLYHIDGLVIVDKSTPKKCDGIRKGLHRLHGEFGFKLDIQTGLKIVNYLDVILTYTMELYPHLEKGTRTCFMWTGDPTTQTRYLNISLRE